jgi:hypothetical protein
MKLIELLRMKLIFLYKSNSYIKNRFYKNSIKSINYLVYTTTLLYGEKEIDILLDKLEKLFLTNPTRYRLNKPQLSRKNSSSKTLLNYFKRLRKLCF